MSFTVTETFVQQFADTFHEVAQQRLSRLESFVKRQSGLVVGESFTTDILGTTEADLNRARHSDLTYANLDIARRIAFMQDASKAELIDSMDKLKSIIQPENGYNRTLIAAINRVKDQVVINAALGAATLKNGTTQALPAGQIIAPGGTGLTLAKLRQAKLLLDDAEMDDSDFFAQVGQAQNQQDPFGNLNMPSYVVCCTSTQIDNLLGDTTVTNSDYNSVKALVTGSVNTFMGALFIRVPATALPLVGGARRVIMYAPRAIEYGVGLETTGRMDYIAQKDAWQVLAKGSFGAVRAEDKGVVAIDCA